MKASRAFEQRFYNEEVAPVLPQVVLDFHSHVSRSEKSRDSGARKKGAGYVVVQTSYGPRDLLRDGALCFPGREYRAVCFAYPFPGQDWRKASAFAGTGSRHGTLYPLILGGKASGATRNEYREALAGGPFFGFKAITPWIGDNYGKVTLEDMVGPAEMGLADELGLVVLLHVPRAGRLVDPVVQRGVRRLSRKYPNASIVLAHCGRCYLPAEMKKAIKSVAKLPNVYLDTAMVMDPGVIEIALSAVGPRRVLFGTDLPIAAMKGRRVRVMDHWVDLVLPGKPGGAFRVQSDNMRATYMAREIVVAIRDAAERVGLTRAERDEIFFGNGMRLLKRAMGGRRLIPTSV